MPLARSGDGEALRWEACAGAEAAADAPTALWLPGLGRDASYWAHAPTWLPRWRHVFCDLRGASGAPRRAYSAGADDDDEPTPNPEAAVAATTLLAPPRQRQPLSFRAWADDLCAVLDAAGVTAPCLVIGHSLGAAVALQLALSHPRRVAALALAAPSARVGAAAAATWRARAAALRAAGGAASSSLADATDAVAEGYDLRSALRTLRAPALLLVGADDALTPPRGAADMAAALPAATLEVLPSVGHEVLCDAVPHALRRLRAWADDVAALAVRAAAATAAAAAAGGAARSRL
jgi:pimeloyl-ACP methyl ester carboxylesterase